MQYLLAIFYSFLFLFLIYKLTFFKKTELPFFVLAGIFVLKILSGIVLALIYRYYYESPNTSDVYKYYLDGKVVYSVLKQNPLDYFKLVSGIGSNAEYLHKYLINTEFWFKTFNYNLLNDNRFVIRIHAILNLISFGNFWVHSVIFSFFSFAGLTAIYRVFIRFIKYKYLLVFSVFFIPSVMFWSSAALKESLIMAMLGLLIFNFFNITEKKNVFLSIIFFILALFLMLLLKFYVLFALIPSLIFYSIYKFYKTKYAILTYGIIYTVIIILFFNSDIYTSYNLPEIVSTKLHDFNNMLDTIQNVGSRVVLPVLEPNFWSFIKAIPNALTNSFFRPFFGDINSIIAIPALIENILIIIFMILSALFIDTKKIKDNLALIIFISSFVFTLFVLIGLTTPVLGALVRYKVPALPFLFILFLFFIDIEKIKRFLSIEKSVQCIEKSV